MARGLAVAVVALLVAAAPAQAASGTFTCAQLPGALAAAVTGDVITLNSSASPGGLCDQQFTLRDFGAVTGTPATWTLKGRDGMNDGFDGSTLPGRVLTGDDVHRLLIQDLTFRDSSARRATAGPSRLPANRPSRYSRPSSMPTPRVARAAPSRWPPASSPTPR